jgi:hypothetical protein
MSATIGGLVVEASGIKSAKPNGILVDIMLAS